MTEKIILLSNGEYGDTYSAALAKTLKEINPGLILKSFGNAGVPTQSVGRAKAEFEAELDAEKPGCVVFIDRPELDIHLMDKAKSKGARVIEYAGANASYAKRRRLGKLKGLVDIALAGYPFETDAY